VWLLTKGAVGRPLPFFFEKSPFLVLAFMKRNADVITASPIPDFYGTPPKRKKRGDEATPIKTNLPTEPSAIEDIGAEWLDQKFLDGTHQFIINNR